MTISVSPEDDPRAYAQGWTIIGDILGCGSVMNPGESLEGELTAAYLYRVVSECEPEARKKRLFTQLALEAEQQAKHWESELAGNGAPIRAFRPPLRARLIAQLVRLLGPRRLTHALAAMKVRGMAVYRSAGYQGAITTAGTRALPPRHDEVGEQHRTEGKDS